MRRNVAAATAILPLCAQLFTAVPGRAAEDTGVETIVARHVEALGGAASLAAIRSLRKVGTYVYNGLEHPLVLTQKRGGLCREEIDGLTAWGTNNRAPGTVIRAYDGATAWEEGVEEAGKVAPMPEAEAVGFIQDADFEGALVGYAEKGHRVALVGPEEIDGVPVLHLEVTQRDGGRQQWYLDRESLLPVKKSMEVGASEYKAAMTWYFDDYREVAGVQMPFYVLIEERLFSREYLFDTVEVNPPVADELFAPPASLPEAGD